MKTIKIRVTEKGKMCLVDADVLDRVEPESYQRIGRRTRPGKRIERFPLAENRDGPRERFFPGDCYLIAGTKTATLRVAVSI